MMSTKYKATTTEDAYFITITIVGWVDVFTRLDQISRLILELNNVYIFHDDFMNI